MGADRTGAVSLGVAGALDHGVVRELAPHAESAGLRAIWVNDTPDGDALASLAAAASATGSLELATGVIPIDRRPAAEIVRAVARLGLPRERLVVGIGSGGLRQGALRAVGEAADELRDAGLRVVIGALGPRMRELAAERAEGVLLNWFTPDAAAAAARASSARTVLYARTVADAAARGALEAEAGRYAGFPAYAAHFAREGIAPLDTTVDLAAADGRARLDAFADAVDELVLRAITPGSRAAELRALVDAAAPGRDDSRG
ncbi:LLM class flavin-dependent oxidoreductase [Homoserinibacter sp. YIM 151385]|uniref:LLM class flavin-dependent oxidoreductase n=1 Tax=Homoserinibacter sp. YIM 151385 TaxID=2985506 RepID=UPI0022F1333C|nr:LLM class flavin-dependent oxidoreductase [Homoserinibacter sp. YIM 151385]WBU37571.1 LLM class flavin-dependent oxidoreductase [Homoserinibacter sp. YIM 151385]